MPDNGARAWTVTGVTLALVFAAYFLPHVVSVVLLISASCRGCADDFLIALAEAAPVCLAWRSAASGVSVTIATGRLRCIERPVQTLEQGLTRISAGQFGHANAHGYATNLRECRFANEAAQLVREFEGSGAAGLRRQQHEFFTAPASQEIGRANRIQQPLGDPFEHLITRRVTVFVVNLLEVIEIEQKQGEGALVATSPLEFLSEGAFKQYTIGQSREVVVGGLPLEAALQILLRRDVVEHRDHVFETALAIATSGDRLPYGIARAIAVPIRDLAFPRPVSIGVCECGTDGFRR